MKFLNFKGFIRSGEPMIWITASSVGFLMIMLLGMLLVVATGGLGHFWPTNVSRIVKTDGSVIAGAVQEESSASGQDQLRIKVGNKDLYGFDFVWLNRSDIESSEFDPELVTVERQEYGNFYGYFAGIKGKETDDIESLYELLDQKEEWISVLDGLQDEIGDLNDSILGLEQSIRKIEFHQGNQEVVSGKREKIEQLELEFAQVQASLMEKEQEYNRNVAVFKDAEGREVALPILAIEEVLQPNTMSTLEKVGVYIHKYWLLVTENPRESNTEGGVFPALFGTIVMVLLMSLVSMPFGVVAAIYLREYATDSWALRVVRIAVNNLAGVPSIVYGVFGLGFFVYTVGASIDSLFFEHLAPTPVFGTGGILWASLTLALLTMPVVIVSTEESLASIPKEIREASLALGATKFQTLVRVVLPMATPGILTGFILSMARAIGEVAPLMLTGAVKLAPSLPLDGTAPFAHFERKFMHLGFYIYDLAFQSPNVEAVLPLVYVATGLLLFLVIFLSVFAMQLRNRVRKKYSTGAF